MLQKHLIKKLFFVAALFSMPLAADNNAPKNISTTYHLVDLGESNIAPEALKKNLSSPSLAPSINNGGQIIGNRAEGGFVHDPYTGDWHPHINGVMIHFHALSGSGDLLVAIKRQSTPTEWMIWPTVSGKNGPRISIPLENHSAAEFYALTSQRMAIGKETVDGKTQLLVWKPEEPLLVLKDEKGFPIKGEFKALNDQGQAAGFMQKALPLSPSVWSDQSGLISMKNFRSKPVPNGEADLADLLIASDGTVYGTYRIQYEDQTSPSDYYAYAWTPYAKEEFRLLDLEGMRISDINDQHVLVGSIQGEAAICRPGQRPALLKTTIPERELEGWKLLEATGINNSDKIVGYGTFNGRTRLFLLQGETKPFTYRLK